MQKEDFLNNFNFYKLIKIFTYKNNVKIHELSDKFILKNC
jgi:hypothetical protein